MFRTLSMGPKHLALRFVLPVLGHVLKHVPRHMLRHVPEHVPRHVLKHVLRHVPTKHVPQNRHHEPPSHLDDIFLGPLRGVPKMITFLFTSSCKFGLIST